MSARKSTAVQEEPVAARGKRPAGRKRSCVGRSRKGRFVEIFRTTPVRTVCPNFFVLAHANGCSFSPRCSYCYLKSSFWFLPGSQTFTNVDRMIGEVRRWIAKDKLESYVLNTGNLSDSLAFERDRPIFARLIEEFRHNAANRPHTLLLVTKGGTDECKFLFEAEPCANVSISFSVNSPAAALDHERGAATVEDRLAAAKKLKKLGWRVRIRIDPMMLGYDYAWIINEVRKLRPERVTLGTLRAEYNLPRFVGKGLFKDLEPPADRKSLARYPLKARMKLYRQAVAALKGICPIGLCEELPEVWDGLGLDKDAKSCNCGG
ncbi:MAG: spore photoproduct lyase family protein [bacterium]